MANFSRCVVAVVAALAVVGVALGAVETVPMGGSIDPVGIFWFNVTVGTPGKSYPVALDTGSSDLLIPKKGCGGCATKPPNDQYLPTASSTSKGVPCNFLCEGCVDNVCQFSNSYATCNLKNPDEPCTVTGPLYTDEIRIGNLPAVRTEFGAIENQTADFEQFQTIDGVMGFDGSTGSWNENTVFNALWLKGALDKNMFAFCLTKVGKYSGSLTLGGLDDKLYTGTVPYTPNVGSFFYGMQVDHVEVAGQKIGLPSTTSSILDSGTNTLLLPDADFEMMHTNFVTRCKHGEKLHGICDVAGGSDLFEGACFAFTEEEERAFPNITVALANNVRLTFGSDLYLVHPPLGSSAPPTHKCLGIQGNSQYFILGNVVQANYYTVVDRANSQIGFADVNRANCGM